MISTAQANRSKSPWLFLIVRPGDLVFRAFEMFRLSRHAVFVYERGIAITDRWGRSSHTFLQRSNEAWFRGVVAPLMLPRADVERRRC